MVNEIILNYLRQYKGKFSVEDLKREILNKGYSENEFNEAFIAVDAKAPSEAVKYKSLGEKKSVTTPKKKGKAFGIISSSILILVVILVIVNFLGIDFFGFNIFNFLE